MLETYGLWIPALAGLTAVGAVSLLFLTKRRKGKKCTSKTDLTGKVTIVTGANTGIGFWTAQDFATRNARVILACRSIERGKEACEKIIAATGNTNVVVRQLDLFDFVSVRHFVDQILQEEDRLDILVNNAAVVNCPQKLNEHGLDITMAINHFGPFLLTLLLIDLLKNSVPSRIVNVSSGAQYWLVKDMGFDNMHCEKPMSAMKAYARSKLANILFTRELAHRLAGTGVSTYCANPGAADTEIDRHFSSFLWSIIKRSVSFTTKTAEEGAQTSIYVAISDDVKDQSGKYYVDCALDESRVNSLANNPEVARKLWEMSCQLTGVSEDI